MRKILTMAIVIAMAIPAVIIAQTPDFYGYENPNKKVIFEWIEDGINAGGISFNSQYNENYFLTLISNLYSASSSSNWSSCQTISGQLESAAANVTGSGDRALVEGLCACAEAAYGLTAYTIILTPSYQSTLQSELQEQGDAGEQPSPWAQHVEEEDAIECLGVWIDTTYHHIGECSHVLRIPDPEE